MFQDLENKAYAVSFKAGRGGTKANAGALGGGRGDGRAYSHGKCLFELH